VLDADLTERVLVGVMERAEEDVPYREYRRVVTRRHAQVARVVQVVLGRGHDDAMQPRWESQREIRVGDRADDEERGCVPENHRARYAECEQRREYDEITREQVEGVKAAALQNVHTTGAVVQRVDRP